jgi:hypothetical protein
MPHRIVPIRRLVVHEAVFERHGAFQVVDGNCKTLLLGRHFAGQHFAGNGQQGRRIAEADHLPLALRVADKGLEHAQFPGGRIRLLGVGKGHPAGIVPDAGHVMPFCRRLGFGQHTVPLAEPDHGDQRHAGKGLE